MNKLDRKGFTLIELLAVIVILAIVLVVTIPSVINSMNDARSTSLQNSSDVIAEWFTKQYELTTLGPSLGSNTVDEDYKNFIEVKGNIPTGRPSEDNLTHEVIIAAGIGGGINNVEGKVYINEDNNKICVELSAPEGSDFYVNDTTTYSNEAYSAGCPNDGSGNNQGDGDTATVYIENLYEPDGNTKPTVNGVTYNLDTDNSLMEDIAGNIRYYGSNPNNYIDIGDVYEIDYKKWVRPMSEIMSDFNIPDSYIPTTESDCKTFIKCENLVEMGFYDTTNECNNELTKVFDFYNFSSVDELCSVIPAGTPILYRIIGVFKNVKLSNGTTKDLIKVVRDEILGYYAWDTSASNVNSGNGINEWSQSDMKKLLNSGSHNNQDLDTNGNTITVSNSLWWNSDSGTCYSGSKNATKPCDFRSTGLSENVHDKIASVIWNLGTSPDYKGYANDLYVFERGTSVIQSPSDGVTRRAEWPGKVALMYPSDYGYAADLSKCKENVYDYDVSTCVVNNWIVSALDQCLLTPSFPYADGIWVIGGDGHSSDRAYGTSCGARPTFFLTSKVKIVGGNGLPNNPYKIG